MVSCNIVYNASFNFELIKIRLKCPESRFHIANILFYIWLVRNNEVIIERLSTSQLNPLEININHCSTIKIQLSDTPNVDYILFFQI